MERTTRIATTLVLAYCLLPILVGFMVKQQTAEAAVVYSISQNGIDLGSVIPIETAETGAEYYDHRPLSGYPDFGPEANKSFIWLHRNTLTDDISVGLIHNKERDGGTGKMFMRVSGLPSTASLDVTDDVPGGGVTDTYSFSPPSAEFRWHWGGHADGAVIGGLNGLWTVTVTPFDSGGITFWHFVSASDGSGALTLTSQRHLK
ncbi:MAG: hypothetical protein SWH78_16190 [Thermodesulfobacteriota bacterium]|nr:hypothetical protein [Thermodesulfobacteriota bacterium]